MLWGYSLSQQNFLVTLTLLPAGHLGLRAGQTSPCGLRPLSFPPQRKGGRSGSAQRTCTPLASGIGPPKMWSISPCSLPSPGLCVSSLLPGSRLGGGGLSHLLPHQGSNLSVGKISPLRSPPCSPDRLTLTGVRTPSPCTQGRGITGGLRGRCPPRGRPQRGEHPGAAAVEPAGGEERGPKEGEQPSVGAQH